jgi:hypothetical protein
VWSSPALTLVNEPDGALVWPYLFWPQHFTVPAVVTPQLCRSPALTLVNEPDGTVLFPR